MSDSDGKETLIQRILGHYAYCVGQGAGCKWIDSEAIGELIDRYRPPLDAMSEEEILTQWHEDKFFLLQLFREIGRVAVLESPGVPYIQKEDLIHACQKVERSNKRVVIEGRWCEWDN